MPSVDLEIADRRYSIACRSGEEDHLRAIAAVVDRRARDAAAALGNLSESRQLLFTALLLADDLKELRSAGAAPPTDRADRADQADPVLAASLERLAERVERLAESLEQGANDA